MIFFFKAEDGALLGKIEKVRVLRNDRREGRLNFGEGRYKFHCAALSVDLHEVLKKRSAMHSVWGGRGIFTLHVNLPVEGIKPNAFVQVKTVILINSVLCAQMPIVGFQPLEVAFHLQPFPSLTVPNPQFSCSHCT